LVLKYFSSSKSRDVTPLQLHLADKLHCFKRVVARKDRSRNHHQPVSSVAD
jgi:hypothetical protein